MESANPNTLIILALLAAGLYYAYSRLGISSVFGFWTHPEIASTFGSQHDYFELSGVPRPTPLLHFDVETAKPRPYRPFRWEYHQNMSLKKMEPDWWIELESTYRERIAERKHLHAIHGKTIINSMPSSAAACRELMKMVLQFLCVRYPKQFQVDEKTGLFHNSILGTQSHIETVDPLMFLLEHVPEDFLVTQEDTKTGLYILRAGVSCSAIGWNMATKMGKTLEEIHGPVPDYKEKMQFSMNRFFSKMPSDKPIQRGSWSLEIGQPLFLQPNDPHFKLRETQSPDLDTKDIYLRVDWQTLRRLPISKAIIFNFKALFTPVTQFESEAYVPRLMARILREAKPSFLEYKATHHVVHKLLPALEKWAEEQERKGWVPKGWKERTLDEDPFFPGWELQQEF